MCADRCRALQVRSRIVGGVVLGGWLDFLGKNRAQPDAISIPRFERKETIAQRLLGQSFVDLPDAQERIDTQCASPPTHSILLPFVRRLLFFITL